MNRNTSLLAKVGRDAASDSLSISFLLALYFLQNRLCDGESARWQRELHHKAAQHLLPCCNSPMFYDAPVYQTDVLVLCATARGDMPTLRTWRVTKQGTWSLWYANVDQACAAFQPQLL